MGGGLASKTHFPENEEFKSFQLLEKEFSTLLFFFYFAGAQFLRIIRICFHSNTIFGSSKRSVEHKQAGEALGSRRGEERRGCFLKEFRTKCA